LQANTCIDMEARRDVFQAIADPTRREIINLIAHKPQNLNAISANFEISRQAVSLHIKILEECGLIKVIREGNNRFCKADLGKLSEVHDWVEQYRAMWTQRFNNLRKRLENETKNDKTQMKDGKGK
jgi:DNA-binding transcriptional ArsR family regulator